MTILMTEPESENLTRESSTYEKVGELVSIYLRGTKWWVNYQHDGQHRKSLKTESKKEAKLRALRIEREIVTGNFQPEKRAPSIAQIADEFRNTKVGEGIAPGTLRKYDNCIRLLKELAAELKLTDVSKITPAFMDKFRKRRTQEIAKRPGRDGQKTAANDLVTIRGIVKFALERKFIRTDPLTGFKIKKAKTKPQPYWIQDELERILRAAKLQPHQDVYRLLAGTGMRIGEVEHLTWEDVDFENNVIKVQEKPGWKPKSGDARSIPMSTEVADVLQRQPRRSPLVFTFPADDRRPVRRIRQRRILNYLKRLLKGLGMRGHVHTFRHTFISMALTRGVPEATVRAWVGHVDAEVIRKYTHIASEESHSAMQRLEESIKDRRKPE